MKKALEDLIFIGRIEEEYEIVGKKWVLATLTAEQQIEAISQTSELDAVSRSHALRMEILARALKKVNGVEIDDVKEAKDLLNKLPLTLIGLIFEKYDKLYLKQEQELNNLDNLKN